MSTTVTPALRFGEIITATVPGEKAPSRILAPSQDLREQGYLEGIALVRETPSTLAAIPVALDEAGAPLYLNRLSDAELQVLLDELYFLMPSVDVGERGLAAHTGALLVEYGEDALCLMAEMVIIARLGAAAASLGMGSIEPASHNHYEVRRYSRRIGEVDVEVSQGMQYSEGWPSDTCPHAHLYLLREDGEDDRRGDEPVDGDGDAQDIWAAVMAAARDNDFPAEQVTLLEAAGI